MLMWGIGIQVQRIRGLQVWWLVEAEGRLQRTKVRGLGECLGAGVQGSGFGDITTVDRMKGKGLRGVTSQRHWERSKGGHLGTLGRTQRRSQGGDA